MIETNGKQPLNSYLPNIYSRSSTATKSWMSKRNDLSTDTNKPEEFISVFPREATFESIAVNTTYSALFSIRNTSDRTIFLRIVAPTLAEHFQLIFIPPKLGLAPGLEVSFKVLFSTREANRDYEDKCVILTENVSVEIPLRAMSPSSELIFPSTFDMGTLPLMRSETKYIEMKNVGTKEGTFRFIMEENNPIYISPMSGIVGAKSTQQIKVGYYSLLYHC